MDILFHTNDYLFSYRVAGICIKNDKILLQKPTNDTAFAFPGGHVTLGETNEQTLIREFREEIDADINVGDLKWVGELFFPWGNKQCHQICLYYNIDIKSDNKCLEDIFIGKELLQERKFDIEYYWIPLSDLKNIEIYPTNAKELVNQIDSGVQHFIYHE